MDCQVCTILPVEENTISQRLIRRIAIFLRVRLAITNVILLIPVAFCTNALAENFSYMHSLKSAEKSIGDLDIFSRLENLSPDKVESLYESKGNDIQKLMTMRSLTGDSTGAAEAFRWRYFLSKSKPSIAQENQETLESVTAENALEAIVAKAKMHQIVILNEAHQEPIHRVFAAKVARELKKIGFNYLAGETFRPNIPQQPGYVDTSMGFYLREPMFGEFIRNAIKDKWNFVGYDVYPEGQNIADLAREREFGAAQNIIRQIFSKDPNAKVFIYVGYGHARKEPAYTDEKTYASLAAVLQHRLGVEPLTINQSDMFSHGDKETDNPVYRKVLERFPSSNPIVLKKTEGEYAVLSGRPGYDMEVFHPDGTMLSETGRPIWMQKAAGLHALAIPSELLPKDRRRLIQAFHVEDGPNAVPADMVMVEVGRPPKALMLPAGKFRLTYEE